MSWIMLCFHICQIAFVELPSREVANILQVFDLSCNRAYPHLDKCHIFFLIIAVIRASSLLSRGSDGTSLLALITQYF